MCLPRKSYFLGIVGASFFSVREGWQQLNILGRQNYDYVFARVILSNYEFKCAKHGNKEL